MLLNLAKNHEPVTLARIRNIYLSSPNGTRAELAEVAIYTYAKHFIL